MAGHTRHHLSCIPDLPESGGASRTIGDPAAAPPEPGPDDVGGAGRGARGLGAHRPALCRGALRCRGAGVRNPWSWRGLPVARGPPNRLDGSGPGGRPPRGPGRGRRRLAVRISPEGRRLAAVLGRLQPIRVRRARPPDDDGWVEATFRLESIDGAAVDLLSLGPRVEALSPSLLRDKVAALVLPRPSCTPDPEIRGVTAEGVGFEPTDPCRSHAFQAARSRAARTPPGHIVMASHDRCAVGDLTEDPDPSRFGM